MSREKHLKRLKESLNETQHILGELAVGTGKDASKRLNKANRKLQDTYDDAATELDALLGETTRDLSKQYNSTKKDVQKQYLSTRKDLNKQAAKAKDQLSDRFADTRAAARAAKASLGAGAVALAAKADLPSRAASAASFIAKSSLAAKALELATKSDLKGRTAGLLENAANGFVSARNKLNPDNKIVIRNERDRHNISKAGYFVRFSALAIIIISKRHKLMELGTQLYNKLKDSEGRAQLTQDAREQFDTLRRLITAYSNGQYRELPYRSLVKIVAAVIYFVSVADLIPDFIPVLGLTDDLAILAWVFSSVKDDLQQFVDWEAAEEKRRTRLAANKSDKSDSGTSPSGLGSEGSSTSSVANVGTGPAVADRKASPNVTTTTGQETGSKATVTTGTSNTGSTGSASSTSGSSSTGSSAGSAGSFGNTGSSASNPGNRNSGSQGGSAGNSNSGNKS